MDSIVSQAFLQTPVAAKSASKPSAELRLYGSVVESGLRGSRKVSGIDIWRGPPHHCLAILVVLLSLRAQKSKRRPESLHTRASVSWSCCIGARMISLP